MDKTQRMCSVLADAGPDGTKEGIALIRTTEDDHIRPVRRGIAVRVSDTKVTNHSTSYNRITGLFLRQLSLRKVKFNVPTARK